MSNWKKWVPRRPTHSSHAPADAPLDDDHEADAEQELDDVEEPAGDRERWWETGARAGAPIDPDPAAPQTWAVSPGVHITVSAPPQQQESSASSSRRARIRRWLAWHAAAAGVGWTFGLYQAMSSLVGSPDRGGSAAGLAMAGFAWFFAEVITERLGRYLPTRVRPGLLWVARIPFATALLVTALHAPNAAL